MTPRHSNVSATQLDAAYRATAYIAHLPEGMLTLHVDRPSRQLDRLLKDAGCSTWAFISACNPGSQPLNEAENATRHARLIETVNRLGLKWHVGEGVPDKTGWAPEASLLILGITQNDALALADQFGQNAILFGTLGTAPQLHYINSG